MQKAATWANLLQISVGLVVVLIGGAFAFATRVNKLEWDSIERDKQLSGASLKLIEHDKAWMDVRERLIRIEGKLDRSR